MRILTALLSILLTAGSATAAGPALSGITPGNGASQTSVSAVVSATFASDMDPATLNGGAFRVSGPDGPISGKITYDPAEKTATFAPIAPLMPQADYTAFVSSGAKDKAEQTLSGNYTWHFKTGKDTLVRSAKDVIPPTFFGMHIHHATTTTPWPTIPFGTWRLWDAYVAWPNLEPKKGEWHFENLDKYVAMAAQHKVEIIAPLALSPQWASARPNEHAAYAPGNAAEPGNIEDWKNYVRTVATRYKGRIHIYEIWNEVNIKDFFSGTPMQMVRLAKEAYQIIKTADPSAIVLAPSCTANDWRVSWFEEYLKKGGGEYADVLNYHFYVSPHQPEQMVPFIGKIRQIIADNNLNGKPLWNSESGWNIENHNSTVKGEGSFSKVLIDSEASAYVARAYILNWASGASRFNWYAWDNGNMGFVERDGKTVKPPAAAYAQTYKWLSGARMVSCGKNSEGTWVAGIIEANGRRGWVVWNADKTVNMELPREWKAKMVKALTGTSTNISNDGRLSVGPMPVLVEG
jgi:hypothetical protein